MDPLSICTGVIAILGVAASVGQGLEKLSAFSDARDELVELIQEVCSVALPYKCAPVESVLSYATGCGAEDAAQYTARHFVRALRRSSGVVARPRAAC